ncbi:MAG: hypothetical protein DI623_03100 [Sphingomonas sanxanigenens]|uniref:Uncharacterized protein n=1 Tax=Sphingomonas sanxanigenens TaxID=397260 RepID=A0A2W5ABB2_9SPHN|nr:MAG: hypothetical protein DI623_03100 [Sphingomonas sanxanigenens]
MVWDGEFGDGVNLPGDAGNMFDYAAGAAVPANRYTIYGSNLYRTAAGGTTGASSPPVHTSGAVADNSVSWTFVKTAVLVINVATPSDVFTDATGAGRTAANWPGSNAWSANFALTQGYVTLTKHTAGPAIIRHFALDLVGATLGPLNVLDRSGKPLTALYTNNPEGVTVAKFTASAGANAYALTGTAAEYYEIVARDASFEIRTKVGAGRQPSSASGATLGVIQTDATAANGPTFTTWLVKSSGAILPSFTPLPARDSETNRHDRLLDSKSWAKIEPVLDAAANEWPGYQGQPFAGSYTVDNEDGFLTAWNMIAAGRDGASWYRIAIAGAGWASNLQIPAINMGAGGLLVEPAAGHDPLLEWLGGGNTGTMVRVHWRNLCIPGQLAKANIFQMTGGAVAGNYAILKISGCRIGRGFAPGYNMAVQGASMPSFMVCANVEQLILEGNRVRGVAQYAAFSNSFYVVTRNEDVTEATDDAFAPNTAFDINAPRGIFIDDHCRFLADQSGVRACPDIGNLFADGDQPHPDVIQYRDFVVRVAWAADSDTAAPGLYLNVGGRALNPNNDKIYQLVTPGRTAASGMGPSGTGSNIVDGTAVWSYVADYVQRGRKLLVYARGLKNHAGGMVRGTTTSANLTIRQFFINSHMAAAGNPATVVAVNCASFSCSSYGLALSGTDYGALIRCTMGGPGIVASGSEGTSAFNQNPQIVGSLETEGYASGTIMGPAVFGSATPAINVGFAFDQGDNLTVDFRGTNNFPALEPSALLAGPSGGFGDQLGVPIYSPPIDISANADPANFWAQMLAMSKPLAGNYGVIAEAPTSVTFTWTERVTDALGQQLDVAMSLTVDPA